MTISWIYTGWSCPYNFGNHEEKKSMEEWNYDKCFKIDKIDNLEIKLLTKLWRKKISLLTENSSEDNQVLSISDFSKNGIRIRNLKYTLLKIIFGNDFVLVNPFDRGFFIPFSLFLQIKMVIKTKFSLSLLFIVIILNPAKSVFDPPPVFNVAFEFDVTTDDKKGCYFINIELTTNGETLFSLQEYD